MSLKGNKKRGNWENLVGYTLNELIDQLNKTMPEGYYWQDYLNADLVIDHIIPVSVFNFTKAGHTDFKKCWDLSNFKDCTENPRPCDFQSGCPNDNCCHFVSTWHCANRMGPPRG